jgi:hypothetical protein
MDSKAKSLGKKGFRNLSPDEMEYLTTMDGAEYGEYKRERMATSGIGSMLEKFEQLSKKQSK